MTQDNDKLSRRTLLRNGAIIAGVVGSSALIASCAPRPAPSPPPVAQAAPPPPPPMPQVAPMPAPAPMMQTKREARYQWRPHRGQRCAGCAHFLAPNGCEIVEGRISPRGWCRNYVPRA